jgi:hypothetical protein
MRRRGTMSVKASGAVVTQILLSLAVLMPFAVQAALSFAAPPSTVTLVHPKACT